jgi:methionyl-tRNA formyltransferase
MNYVFVGQNAVGGSALNVLLEQGVRPLLVVTREHSRYPNKVWEVCLEYDIPVEMTVNINTDQRVLRLLSGLSVDVIFCCAWANIIRQPLLRLPKLGWVNFHPSLLPSYRGSYPIEWQLINGEEYAGCTAHFMVERFDAGNIICQKRLKIDSDDDNETLRVKCGTGLGELAVECYHVLCNNPRFKGAEQDEAVATYCPPREHAQAITWSVPALEIYNRVRGLSPYPCAIMRLGDQELQVGRVSITNMPSSPATTGVLRRDSAGKMMIGALDRFVSIESLRIGDCLVDDPGLWPR